MSSVPSVYTFAAPITKSDTDNIAPVDGVLPVGLYVGTKGSTGTVVLVYPDDATATFVGLLAGTVYQFGRYKRVNSTTTDASNLMALYQV